MTDVARRHGGALLRWFLIAFDLLMLAMAPSAGAATSYPELDAFLSKVAMRPVSLVCENTDEDKALVGAWAHVRLPVGRQHEAQARTPICEGALAVAHGDETFPDWKRALGVAVIVHEGYHLRHWSGAASEAKVECKAIRHFKIAVQLLGGSRQVADELLPFALAYHYKLVYLSRLWSRSGVRPGRDSYEDPTCELPDLEEGTDAATEGAATTTAPSSNDQENTLSLSGPSAPVAGAGDREPATPIRRRSQNEGAQIWTGRRAAWGVGIGSIIL